MSDLMIGAHAIRRDGDMWCLTDLWRAAGAPTGIRPANWLRKEGLAFVEFLRASASVPGGLTRKMTGNPGKGEPPTTWGHWQVALAYAKALSPEFHARVNEVYRAFMAGQLVASSAVRPEAGAAERELIRVTLRLEAMRSTDYQSIWEREMKLEFARLRRLRWNGEGREPQPMAMPYGRTLRIILGDAAYEELKRRNPAPRSGSLHPMWLQADRLRLVRREDLQVALALARQAYSWPEYEAAMRGHFRRAPIQLRLEGVRGVSPNETTH